MLITGRSNSSDAAGNGLRIAVLASADLDTRSRVRDSLAEIRWQVFEAGGAAEAVAHIEARRPEVLLLDDWLPDLQAQEFAEHIRLHYPAMDLLQVNGTAFPGEGGRSPRRGELLLALRAAQGDRGTGSLADLRRGERFNAEEQDGVAVCAEAHVPAIPGQLLPDLVGTSPVMHELAHMIRLVAPRSTTVLIEGETGTGKEVVAHLLHRLSRRAEKPFVVLNCAAIPETLLEAELFGHTRGAFTGAVQSRTGRIEAADGGTLFLDEIGEMPLALQAKMLRFLECGELQRVGDNGTVRVDVRVIAATHQPLEQRAEEQLFRLDLYHRLAVFPIEIAPLRDRMADLPLLAEHLLERMGRSAARKRLTPAAMDRLRDHRWPGNVRELSHVLERASILSEDRSEIGPEEIRVRRRERS